ncbi:MAG: copper homeostasis protein CutC [Actinobacteria bacterium]|nr:copper homeostasis protein CutC [Actinomycetota bacterium]
MDRRLEICCYSVADAILAQNSGADRIELCAGRPEGGTTPSVGFLVQAAKSLKIPVVPMIRPRGGDFVYDDLEYAAMRVNARMIAEQGFSGVVFGILDDRNAIDVTRCTQLLADVRGINPAIEVTFHRAFDVVADPYRSYRILTELGFTRVLTSGQAETASAGLPLISELVGTYGNDPIVMPGGGVRTGNAEIFLNAGALDLHSSATLDSDSGVDADTVRTLARLVHA